MTNVQTSAPTSTRSNIVDNNSVVTKGMVVSGRFAKKFAAFCVINFVVDGKNCSGTLHVSQFPSENRADRDTMFAFAKPGMPAPNLTVIEVIPPSGDKRFTSVRLSSRSQDKVEKISNSSNVANGGKHKHKVKSVAGNADSSDRPARVYRFAAPEAPAKAPKFASSVDNAVVLIDEINMPTKAIDFASIGRAFAIKQSSRNPEFVALVDMLKKDIAEVSELTETLAKLNKTFYPETVAAGIAVYEAQKEAFRIKDESASLKVRTARYASQCSKAKRLGDACSDEFKSELAQTKAALDNDRAALLLAREKNKTQADAADYSMMCAVFGETGKADEVRALAIQNGYRIRFCEEHIAAARARLDVNCAALEANLA